MEGENRVFQKIEVPFFIENQPERFAKVKATVFNESGHLIHTIMAEPASKGLNYLVWKLDEKSSHLPGAWITEESRGIPVLPGRYKIVLQYENWKDSSYIQVIPDPRFELAAEIDEQLHTYQKRVDAQVELLASLLQSIDRKQAALSRLKKQLKELKYEPENPLFKSITEIQKKLEQLQATGRTPRPERQVGAWQTSEVTPYSKMNDVQRIAMSRVRPISQQEKDLLAEATQLVQDFKERVDRFWEREWKACVEQVKQANIDWLRILE